MSVEIPLSRGLVTIVDEADAEAVLAHRWYANVSGSKRQRISARRNTWVNGKRGLVYLHRWLLNAPIGVEIDHINRNSLDNRRSNLRMASRSQNCANRPAATGTFKGVTWHKDAQRWVAQIAVEGKNRHIGCFLTEEEAALAYDVAALDAFGEFAWLNFGGER